MLDSNGNEVSVNPYLYGAQGELATGFTKKVTVPEVEQKTIPDITTNLKSTTQQTGGKGGI